MITLQDKFTHVVVWYLGTFLGSFIYPLNCLLVIVIFGAFAKELYDYLYGNGWCWYDLLSDFIGIVFALYVIGNLK